VISVKKKKVLLEFEHVKDKSLSEAQANEFVKFSQSQLEKNGLPIDFFTSEELELLAEVAHTDIVPVAAILAGMLGQEVVKAISQKDEPMCNCFYFEGATGAGTVRKIVAFAP